MQQQKLRELLHESPTTDADGEDISPEVLEGIKNIGDALLKERPDDPVVLYLLGVSECNLEHPAEAAAYFQKALLLKPDSRKIAFGYALALTMLQQPDQTIALLKPIVERNPHDLGALYLLGDAYRETDRLPEAIAAYQAVLALKSDYAPALNDLGSALAAQKKYLEAKVYYERAIACAPNNPFYFNNLGISFFRTGQFPLATACYQKALELNPEYPEAFCNLSAVERNRGQFEKAIQYSQKAIALRPEFPAALNNLGNALKAVGKFEDAINAYRSALCIKNGDAELEYNLSMALLAVGNFEEGWPMYEARWRTKHGKRLRKNYPQRLWRGETQPGATILIHFEQGFGDTLQFCRYGTLVTEKGLRVIMRAPTPLARLMQSLKKVEVIDEEEPDTVDYDFQSPMMNLPQAFDTRLETIPAPIPYLRPTEQDVLKWKKRLEPLTSGKPRIGLVWSGRDRNSSIETVTLNLRRSMSPRAFEPLVLNPNFHFFSLQKGRTPAPEFLHLIDLMDECEDFADTAALIENLDLVISVDTAVAHLTGAIGKPIWLLNRFDSCWRWQLDSAKTPWYPNMRIFHQPKTGDWGTVIARVINALGKTEFPIVSGATSK